MNRITPLALVLACAGVFASYAETVATGSRVIVPFELVGTRAQYHVIAWFSGHPEYESVEAFVCGNGKIRAILTRHGGAQIDAFNYERPDVTSGRDWYASAIAFDRSKDGKKARLEMRTPDGKALVLSYTGAGKPSAQHGGLTDPGNHSSDTGLPAMWRKTSGVSGPDSSVSIDGKDYPIPMDTAISRPPFFTAYSAFLSEGFESLFIRAYTTKKLTTLDCAGDGEEKDPVRVSYETGVATNVVTLSRRGGVASIESSTEGLDPDGSARAAGGTVLRFEPPLANLASLPEGTESISRFFILFDGGKSKAIEGTITARGSNGHVAMILQPEKPDWLRATRAIRYDIDLGEADAVGSATVLTGDQRAIR